ncbi:tRNA adenosine(34) deaminase TadA [Comamonas composti]|uniref:tRNA adenosine(34) deaminase TadA n=1 Tax=Comamonas composti TaxID=408558 RepID=UPI00040581F0|nr:tRNA adenosine(34) deaminase TadA [Comamonas composti]
MTANEQDQHWMRHALSLAHQAAAAGEVPVGAVVVKNGVVIGRGCNSPVSACDPTAHAEIQALREAAQSLSNYRLDGCTLYVTLEPCTMCSGAMLHARLARVVYGASEPKTGAAGSVLNVFDEGRINHHTRMESGVLADECAALLADFFRQRRVQQRRRHQACHPLQDWALRNPDTGLEDLPGLLPVDWRSDLAALRGLRLAVVDQGPKDAPLTWLCVHGSPAWSHWFAPLIRGLAAAGQRVVAPDLPGFGRSDQPKKPGQHTAAWHVQVLAQLVQSLDLQRIVLLGHDDGARLGLALAQSMPERFVGGWLINAWPGQQAPQAYAKWFESAARKPGWPVARAMGEVGDPALDWPFARPGHRAALEAWPRVQAELPSVPGELLAVWQARQKLWLQGSALDELLPASLWSEAWEQVLCEAGGQPGTAQLFAHGHWDMEPVALRLVQAVEYFGR